jgi:antirestriction protein ArdC
MGSALGNGGGESAPRPAQERRNPALLSGINVLILCGAVIEHGFTGQSWLTFRQALSLDGHVRKGERDTTVVYADRFTPEDERRRAMETGDEAQAIPFLKRTTVSNVAQCEGLPANIMTVARRSKPISSCRRPRR